jgi:hypothetical protein
MAMAFSPTTKTARQTPVDEVSHAAIAAVLARANLSAGVRFEQPASLVEKAEQGEIYSDDEVLVTAG